MAFLDAAKSLKAAAMTDTTVHNLTVTESLDSTLDTTTVPSHAAGRHHRDAAVGTWRAARASALLHVIAKPSHFAPTERWLLVVERQCQTSSCRARSAGCSQAGLCASGSGGE